jgi:hypothetical protein
LLKLWLLEDEPTIGREVYEQDRGHFGNRCADAGIARDDDRGAKPAAGCFESAHPGAKRQSSQAGGLSRLERRVPTGNAQSLRPLSLLLRHLLTGLF